MSGRRMRRGPSPDLHPTTSGDCPGARHHLKRRSGPAVCLTARSYYVALLDVLTPVRHSFLRRHLTLHICSIHGPGLLTGR
jgi:hypothetical protein